MKAILWPILALIVLAVLSGCSSGTDDQEMLNDAVAWMEVARSESDSYQDALESYEKAKKGIDQILAEHEDSDTGQALRSGDKTIAGLSLQAFEALESPLKLRATAELELLPNALLVAGTVRRVAERDRVLAEIAVEHAEAGDLQGAEAAAQQIEGAVDKHWALAWIAGGYASDGQSARAEALFDEARDIVDQVEQSADRGWMLTEVAGRYAEAGYEGAAEEALDRARLDADTIEGREKAWLLAEIGGKYARIGETEQAEELFDKALELGDELEDKVEQLQTMLWLADQQLDYGEPERAGEMLSRAEDRIAEAIEDSEPAEQIGMVVELVGGYIRYGDEDSALRLLDRARRAAGVLASDYHSAWGLAVTARYYAELERHDEAAELLEESIDRVAGIEGAGNRDSVRTEIAIAYAQLGQSAEGLHVAESILGNYDQAWALTRMASIHSASGDTTDEDMRASLHRLTHKHRPIESFWE